MIPSPSDLSYFVEVANTLNISRAAERLGISQPSLTLAMQRIENAVGTELLIRSKQGVSLTRAGRQLLAHSAQLLQSWDEIKSRALASVNDVQGTYIIGCHTSVALNTVPQFLPKLMEDHPKLDIQLKHDLSRKITEDVISLKTDMGIVVNPVKHPDLVIIPLFKGEVTFWTRENSKTPMQDLDSKQKVLICDPSLLRSQSLIDQMEAHKLSFDRIIHSSSLEVVASLVSQGCGIGILPTPVAKRTDKKLIPLPRTPVFHDDHALIYRVENKNIQSIKAIQEAIKDSFS